MRKIDKKVKVGEYTEKFNTILGISLPLGDICIYPGVEKHVNKKHFDYLKYIEKISDIISDPDYIGKHPDIDNSIELIKVFDENILVSINLDVENGYLYVSSLYNIKEPKIQRRLHSGRLKKFI